MDEQPVLLPIGEVRRQLGGVSRNTVNHLIKRGDLTRAKVGKWVMVTSESLDAYLDRITHDRTV